MLFSIQEYKEERLHAAGQSACTTAESTGSVGTLCGPEPELGQAGEAPCTLVSSHGKPESGLIELW